MQLASAVASQHPKPARSLLTSLIHWRSPARRPSVSRRSPRQPRPECGRAPLLVTTAHVLSKNTFDVGRRSRLCGARPLGVGQRYRMRGALALRPPTCGLWFAALLDDLSTYLSSGRASLHGFAEASRANASKDQSTLLTLFYKINRAGRGHAQKSMMSTISPAFMAGLSRLWRMSEFASAKNFWEPLS
jgi:hypothetical protein